MKLEILNNLQKGIFAIILTILIIISAFTGGVLIGILFSIIMIILLIFGAWLGGTFDKKEALSEM